MAIFCFHNGVILNGTSKFDRGAVLISGKKIIDIFNETRFSSKKLSSKTHSIDVKGAYICPGFIDTHIHGFGGFGVDMLDAFPEAILEMARLLPKYGVTSFCPTIYPKPLEQFQRSIRLAVKNIELQNEIDITLKGSKIRGANIAGLHLEGPFISKERLGVHNTDAALMPSIPDMEQIIKLGKGYIRNMTVAPELRGMHEIAILGSLNNIVMQAGHTNAEYSNILEGVQVGIRHSTHFFNAMSPLKHRNPGTVGSILLHPEISCEIIADGHHVHPSVIELLLKNKSHEKIVLITDSLTPTHQEGSPIYANGEEVTFRDNLFYRKKDNVIAGSALTMQQGVRNLRKWGVSLENAVRMATFNPAEIIRIPRKGMFSPGYDADMLILDQNLDVLCTIIQGSIAYCTDAYKEILHED